MTAQDVLDNLRNEVGDTGATPFVTDDQGLLWVQDAVREYSKWRPRDLEGTFQVAASTYDYAWPSGARSIKHEGLRLLDEDGLEVSLVPFTTFATTAGKYIRLVGSLPTEGDTVKVFYRADHTQPATLAATLTVDAADQGILGIWMRARYAERRAQYVGNDGSWKVFGRSEDGSKGAQGLMEMAKALKEEFRSALSTGGAVAITDGYPREQGLPSRADLGGAGRFQGPLGPTGQNPGQRWPGVTR